MQNTSDNLTPTLPNVTFKTRVRDESVAGENPFRWEDKTSHDVFSGKNIVIFALPEASGFIYFAF